MESTHTHGTAVARPRPLWANPWLLAVLAGCLLVTLMRPLLRHEPDPPPIIGELPAFALVRESGASFTREDLHGSAWIVGFVFTRCQMACPLITRAMLDLQQRLEANAVAGVRLLAVTVDPEHDTPQRLAAWGAARGVDPARWVLGSGSREEVHALVVDGFQTAMGEPETVGGLVDIAHAGRLALVDTRGRLRGYFEIDEAGLDEVLHRAAWLSRHDD